MIAMVLGLLLNSSILIFNLKYKEIRDFSYFVRTRILKVQ